jgi:hypothetical protein
VGVGFEAIAIIVIISVQDDFQHLTQILERRQGFVDSCLAHGWKLAFDASIELGCAGVPLAGGNQTYQFYPLRGEAKVVFLQGGNHFIKTYFGIGHCYPSITLIYKESLLLYHKCIIESNSF